ncbi:hypothetical protein [Aestuariivirga sp.]|uniref:hypothetical protein n=1 Tax=Aestuariivirga sp. TaxID=2650926 RepID=UPI0039E541D6
MNTKDFSRQQKAAEKKLDAALERVTDQKTFVAFLLALSEDYALERKLQPEPDWMVEGPLGWVNFSIDAFLEAGAYQTIDSGYENLSANIWRRCAEIIAAGKFYE